MTLLKLVPLFSAVLVAVGLAFMVIELKASRKQRNLDSFLHFLSRILVATDQYRIAKAEEQTAIQARIWIEMECLAYLVNSKHYADRRALVFLRNYLQGVADSILFKGGDGPGRELTKLLADLSAETQKQKKRAPKK